MPSFVDSNTTGSGFGGWNTGGGYGWDGGGANTGGGSGGGSGSIWADLIPLLGSAASSYFQADAAGDASRAGQQGAAAGIAEQRRQFDLIMQMLAPQRGLGDQASNALARLYGFQPTAGTTGLVPAPGAPGAPSASTPNALPGAGTSGSGGLGIIPSVVTAGTGRFPRPLMARDGSVVPKPAGFDERIDLAMKNGKNKWNINAFNGGVLTPEDLAYYDAYHDQHNKPGTLSQIAGGALGVASVALPGLAVMGAAADAGNNALGNNKPAYFDTGMSQPNQPLSLPAGTGTGPSGPMGLDGFFASPDYNFRRGEGMRGIENSFAARGGAASGNALRALTDFNSNLASGEFGNHVNRLLAMSGQGQASTGQAVTSANYTGGNIANLLGQQAEARSSGIVNRSNAVTGGLNDLASFYGYWNRNRGN